MARPERQRRHPPAQARRGRLDAIILAAAGLRRLGREGEIGFRVPGETMVPAPGQGALALQVRAGDEETTAARCAAIGDLDGRCAS